MIKIPEEYGQKQCPFIIFQALAVTSVCAVLLNKEGGNRDHEHEWPSLRGAHVL